MIREMRKVRIIGPAPYLDECIRVLHGLSVLHIETVPEAGVAEEAGFEKVPLEKDTLAEKEFLEKASDELRGIMSLMAPPAEYTVAEVGHGDVRPLFEEISRVGERLKELHATEDELTGELALVKRYERLLEGFAPVVSRLGGLKNFEIMGLVLERGRTDITGLLAEEVGKLTNRAYEMHTAVIDESTIGVVLLYPRKHSQAVHQLITGKSIGEMKLPEEYRDLTLVEALREMRLRKETLPSLIDNTTAEIRRLSKRWYGRTKGLSAAVDNTLEEIGALAYARRTRFAFMVEGYVPVSRYRELEGRIASAFSGRVLVGEVEVPEEERDRVPVLIENPRLIKPFEVFLAALPPPKYGSVDPTPFVAVFFPLFFGLIVGDVGYGGIILAAGLVLRRRFSGSGFLRDIFTVMSVCGASAVAFGFLFGEFFGDLAERLHLLHPILGHRIEALESLMVFTIGVGLGHVVLGFTIALVNKLSEGRLKEAGEKAAYLVVVAAFLALLASAGGYIPGVVFTPALVILALGLAALVVFEGVIGPLEFVKTLGNVLSYIRIMAVGTASVVMALVANRIGGLSESLVAGIIVAGLIHLLNIFLSVLSPVIQSMRLQYVEFMGKFYEGGGRSYRPFSRRV